MFHSTSQLNNLQITSTNHPHHQYRLFHDIYVFLDAGDMRILRPFNLTPSQYRLLMLLDSDTGQNLIRLSERMLVARSTITRLIDQMEHAGLVHRVDDPDDRRAQRIMITEYGADLREQAYRAHEVSLQGRFEMLNDYEQTLLTKLLAKLRDGLLSELETKG